MNRACARGIYKELSTGYIDFLLSPAVCSKKKMRKTHYEKQYLFLYFPLRAFNLFKYMSKYDYLIILEYLEISVMY